MKIDILTLFPNMFTGVLGESMLKIAQNKKKVAIRVHNLRDWTEGAHRVADDKPYGGGSGMVMKIEPIYRALVEIAGETKVKNAKSKHKRLKNCRIILLTPRGKVFDQRAAKKMAKSEHIICIAGHYEGIDERVRDLVTDEISIGNYILTGGEIPAMVIVDAIARLIPGVLGGVGSLDEESFENGLLEYPQYTRPRVFRSMSVPEVLLSGDHKLIQKWRKKRSIEIKEK